MEDQIANPVYEIVGSEIKHGPGLCGGCIDRLIKISCQKDIKLIDGYVVECGCRIDSALVLTDSIFQLTRGASNNKYGEAIRRIRAHLKDIKYSCSNVLEHQEFIYSFQEKLRLEFGLPKKERWATYRHTLRDTFNIIDDEEFCVGRPFGRKTGPKYYWLNGKHLMDRNKIRKGMIEKFEKTITRAKPEKKAITFATRRHKERIALRAIMELGLIDEDNLS